MNIAELQKKARQVRVTCLQMAFDGKEGHLSSSLSYVELLVALFYRWLKCYPDNPKHPDRDRFILSKGHGCTALYAVLADLGFISTDLLSRYNQDDSPFPNHPCIHALPVLEMSAGSLGHGLGVATGIMYGLRLKESTARAVVLLGDGECNEGSVWEGAMFAAAHHMDRLLAIVDYNGIQAVGHSDVIMGHTSLAEKFTSFGWSAITIDGSDMAAIAQALETVPFEPGKPSVIIARTTMGISFIRNEVEWHYRKPTADELRQAINELGERPLHMEP